MSKQNNQVSLFIFIAIIVIVGGIAWYFSAINKSYTWDENYSIKKEQPYSSNIFFELMRSSVKPDSFTLLTSRLDQGLFTDSLQLKNTCYVYFKNSSPHYLYPEVEALKHFVAAGNNYFAISNELNERLVKELALVKTYPFAEQDLTAEDSTFSSVASDTIATIDTTDEYTGNSTEETTPTYYSGNLTNTYYNDYIKLNFTDSAIHDTKGYVINYFFNNNFHSYYWYYFDMKAFNDSLYKPEVLGYFNDSFPCFIRVKYGKGYFYFHSVSMAFTNYHLLSERNYDYVNACINLIGYNKIYWDEAAKFDKFTNQQNNDYKESPLNYILSQRSLRFAWYGLLGVLLLFLLFGIKRRQRVIPIIIPKANTYMEFIESINVLYYRKKDHRNIAYKKWKLFLGFVRQRYSLNTQQINDLFRKQLEERSGLTASFIDELVQAFAKVDHESEYSAKDLIALHQLLDYFYKNCI